MGKLYVFVIDDVGSSRKTVAQKLMLADDGAARFYDGGVLVGAIKSSSWTRIYVENPPTVEKA